MDTTSTFIGIAITVIIVLAIFLIQSSQKKQKRNSKKGFIVEALKHNLKVTETDFWGTYYAIAIDETANKLIYSKIIDAEHNITVIDLNEVADCQIARTNRSYKSKTTLKTETDKIDLVISYLNPNKTKDILEFYNVDVNFQMSDEVSLIEKWETKIKSRRIKKVQVA